MGTVVRAGTTTSLERNSEFYLETSEESYISQDGPPLRPNLIKSPVSRGRAA